MYGTRVGRAGNQCRDGRARPWTDAPAGPSHRQRCSRRAPRDEQGARGRNSGRPGRKELATARCLRGHAGGHSGRAAPLLGSSCSRGGRIDLAVLGLQSIGVIDQRAPRGSSRSVAWAHPLQQPWLIWLRGPRPVRHVHGGPTSWGVSGSWMWARTTRVLRAPRSIARWNRTLRPPCMPLARTRRPSTQAQARSVPW